MMDVMSPPTDVTSLGVTVSCPAGSVITKIGEVHPGCGLAGDNGAQTEVNCAVAGESQEALEKGCSSLPQIWLE